MLYKALIFDLHGTLIPWSKDGFRSMLLDAAALLGADPGGFTRAVGETADDSMTGRFPSIADEFSHVCRVLGVSPEPDALDRAAGLWVDFHGRGYERPYPNAVKVIGVARSAGLKVGLITNCSIDAPRLFADSRFGPMVDAALFSALEGVCKPDRRIYAAASRRLGVSPGECVFVDDSAESLAGAASLGMRAILIRLPGNTSSLSGVDTWAGERVSSFAELASRLDLPSSADHRRQA